MVEDLKTPTTTWALRRTRCPEEIVELYDTLEFTVGRTKDSSLVIRSLYASRRHCLFKIVGQSLRVLDLNSSNGTFLNKVRIPCDTETILKENDIIGLGIPYDLDEQCFVYRILKNVKNKIEDEPSSIPPKGLVKNSDIQEAVKQEPEEIEIPPEINRHDQTIELSDDECLPNISSHGATEISSKTQVKVDLPASSVNKDDDKNKNGRSDLNSLLLPNNSAQELPSKSSEVSPLKSVHSNDFFESVELYLDSFEEEEAKSKKQKTRVNNEQCSDLKRKDVDFTTESENKRKKLTDNKMSSIVSCAANTNSVYSGCNLHGAEERKPSNPSLLVESKDDLTKRERDLKNSEERVCQIPFDTQCRVKKENSSCTVPLSTVDGNKCEQNYTLDDDIIVISDSDDNEGPSLEKPGDNDYVPIKREVGDCNEWDDCEYDDDGNDKTWFLRLSQSALEDAAATRELDLSNEIELASNADSDISWVSVEPSAEELDKLFALNKPDKVSKGDISEPPNEKVQPICTNKNISSASIRNGDANDISVKKPHLSTSHVLANVPTASTSLGSTISPSLSSLPSSSHPFSPPPLTSLSLPSSPPIPSLPLPSLPPPSPPFPPLLVLHYSLPSSSIDIAELKSKKCEKTHRDSSGSRRSSLCEPLPLKKKRDSSKSSKEKDKPKAEQEKHLQKQNQMLPDTTKHSRSSSNITKEESRKEKLRKIAQQSKAGSSVSKHKVKVNIMVKNTKSSRSDKLVEYMLPTEPAVLQAHAKRKLDLLKSKDKKNGQGVSPVKDIEDPTGKNNTSMILPRIPLMKDKPKENVKETCPRPGKSSGKVKDMKKVSFAPDTLLAQVHYIPLERGNRLQRVTAKDAPLISRNVNASEKILDSTLDIICHWNFAWLAEQKKLSMPPPCYGSGSDVYPMLTAFANFEHYKKVVVPLMLLNLWAKVSEEYEQFDKCPRGQMQNIVYDSLEPYNNGTVKLHCHLLLSEKSLQDEIHPFVGDLCQLVVRVGSGNAPCTTLSQNNSQDNIYCVRVFAYVESNTRESYFPRQEDSCFVNTMERPVKKMNLILRVKKMSNWNKNSQLRLKVLSNIRSDLRSFEAVYRLPQSKLCGMILNPTSLDLKLPTVNLRTEIEQKDELNEKQKTAVLAGAAVCSGKQPKICVVQGPPGTGKTKVIINTIMQILNEKKRNENLPHGHPRLRILLCAPSNAAVDELVERLLKIRQSLPREGRFKMVRTGRVGSMRPSIRCISLSELAKLSIQHSTPRNVEAFESLKLEVDNLQARKNSYMLSLENAAAAHRSTDQYKKKLDEINKKLRDLQMVHRQPGDTPREQQRDMEKRILYGAEIVATTLGSCFNAQMSEVFGSGYEESCFSCCIIDEASQCVEPELLVPLMYGVNQIVLVGDPEQLPATVLSKVAQQKYFGQSLLTRFSNKFYPKRNNPFILLDVQYRMHEEICLWPNWFMYDGRLSTAKSINRKCPMKPYFILSQDFKQTGEMVNEKEAYLVSKLAGCIKKMLPQMSVGIIAPYQKQKHQIVKHMNQCIPGSDVHINTVDSFQGQECDVVIFSCTRTQGVGFLAESQRLNVALTRARYSLIICGNFVSLKADRMWNNLVENAKSRQLFFHITNPNVPSEVELYKYLLKSK